MRIKNLMHDNMMKNANDYQVLFFEKLKSQFQNINLVYDIANVLNISVDAVYRRFRGKTLLNFQEIVTLCKHYKINIDEYIGSNPYEVKFRYAPMQQSNFKEYYEKYVIGLKNYLKMIVTDSSTNKKILFAATDIPIFHLCKSPILKAFKVYTWYKLFEKSDEGKFSPDNMISPDTVKVLTEISDLYDQIDSVEIWTNNTINSYLNLIKYFYDIDCFNSFEDVMRICNQLIALVDVLKTYGEQGYKQYGCRKSSFKLFFSEADLDNNLIYAETDNHQVCFIKLYSINAISTSDITFCNEIKSWFDSTVSKSVLISGCSQKQFVLFIKEMSRKIENLKAELLSKYNASHALGSG
jgi:hypothetical protein